MALSSKETQNPEFWRKRIKEAGRPIDAIGVGFDWKLLDEIHKKIIGEHIKPTDKVLDVACGIGRTAHWFPDSKYIGIDFMPEFINIARQINPQKLFFVYNVTEPLPFNDHQFDWAYMISVKTVIGPVIGWDKWAEVEKELKRVAKKVLILEYGNSDPQEASKYEIL